MNKEGDVISMSFAMLEKLNKLGDICNKAKTADIVMLCSDHDQGPNVTESWPTAYPSTLTIAAGDEYGTIVRNRNKQSHQYALFGLNVAAGSVPFLESLDRISGSSAVTAIAAGLSSLILPCDRLSRGDGVVVPPSRISEVKKHLDNMKADKDTNYVMPEEFGKIDERFNPGEDIDAWKVIGKAFGSYRGAGWVD